MAPQPQAENPHSRQQPMTFTAGQTEADVLVPIRDDSEQFKVLLYSATGATIEVSEAVGRITDND